MVEIMLIILICVSNFLFAYCGYLIGRKNTIITIEKGDKIHIDTIKNEPVYEDEEAIVPDELGDKIEK